MESSNSLTFINHASVLIKGHSKGLLTDPWYQGEAFHLGWRLIIENDDSDIERLLKFVDFIWISHEHPDHFSIQFLKKFKQQLIDRNVTFLFQETQDKRVFGWLLKEGFKVIELHNQTWFSIEEGFRVKVIKDEFYDSALVADVGGVKIFNLNDCPVHSKERIHDFHKLNGDCDILLTQFSYAAWKGGRANKSWRELAAHEKLKSIIDQADSLNAKIIVPFASFVRFSNELNYYLNDSVNTPKKTLDFISEKTQATCVFMMPFETISIDRSDINTNPDSIIFWEEKFNAIGKAPLDCYNKIYKIDELESLFKNYLKRVKLKNSWWMIRLVGVIGIFSAFQPVHIRLIDQNLTVFIDVINQSIGVSTSKPDVEMHSESLAFILKNPFGFDTLTVNGCFEEKYKGGFTKFTKVFALENLNVLGYSFGPSLFLKPSLIAIFLSRLITVSKRLLKV